MLPEDGDEDGRGEIVCRQTMLVARVVVVGLRRHFVTGRIMEYFSRSASSLTGPAGHPELSANHSQLMVSSGHG